MAKLTAAWPFGYDDFAAAASEWTEDYWTPAELALGESGPAPQEITNAGGIASSEAFGTARVELTLAPGGIASAEAFGAARIELVITTTGIASSEVFGLATVTHVLMATGISSAEAFGTAEIEHDLAAPGIASSEAFGTPTVVLVVYADSIPSAEAFGVATVTVIEPPTQGPWRSTQIGGGPRMDELRRIERLVVRQKRSKRELMGVGRA